MPDYQYLTVDVFTDTRFGGNPLAVFPSAVGLDTKTMQALAAEMNYSETTFVLAPENPANTAKVRIFNRSHEMPFAGHPNVGTAYVVAHLGLARGPLLRFEEQAGIVEVRLSMEDGHCLGAEIDAPQPLSLHERFAATEIAPCLSLDPASIRSEAHPPIRASVGVDFVLVEVEAAALARAKPDLTSYRRVAASRPELNGRLSLFLYTTDGPDVRARMFAPLAGTWEDPATGSANAALAALRLSISGASTLAYSCIQGVELGRPSRLALRAWRAADGVRAGVGGRCVAMFRGAVTL